VGAYEVGARVEPGDVVGDHEGLAIHWELEQVAVILAFALGDTPVRAQKVLRGSKSIDDVNILLLVQILILSDIAKSTLNIFSKIYFNPPNLIKICGQKI
jgi:hypothetical protein